MSKVYHIQVGEQAIPIHLERTRGRSIRLLYQPSVQGFILRTPNGSLTPRAREFVLSKQDWMLQNLQKRVVKDERVQQFFQTLENGTIPVMGQSFRLQRETGLRPRFMYLPEAQTIRLTLTDGQADWHPYLREGLRFLAKKILTERTVKLAAATDSTIQRIFIKGQKTRWGSCSSHANINLNWHLIFLAEPLIDYVIIHELMHLREMNHSPKFWAWVKQYYPTYKQAEKQIRQQEWLIGILGK